ncbi:MAG: hypothetical protein HXX17_07105 [Geobacteraceae bacterium]|nr:hypothetical protein [Geobacteraceae bacterium]
MKMKKSLVATLAAVMIMSFASIAAAGEQKWTCSKYYHGEYTGYTTFWASSHSEAMSKATEFYKSYTYDHIKCE